MKTMQKSSQSGFTLVELAIVMMIIGLLIGGILKGQELMENARVTSTVAQIQGYDSAVTTFRDIYNAFPGDMANAEDRVPNCDPATTNCSDGNGDSIVGNAGGLGTDQTGAITNETLQFWKHLLMADLISGVTTGTTVAWGETHAAAKIGGGFHIGHENGTYGAGTSSVSGHYLLLQNPAAAIADITTAGNAPINSVRAGQIDRKMDDGMPGTGSVIGAGTTGATDGCYDAAGPAGVYLGNTIKSCNMAFRIQG